MSLAGDPMARAFVSMQTGYWRRSRMAFQSGVFSVSGMTGSLNSSLAGFRLGAAMRFFCRQFAKIQLPIHD